MSMYSFVVICTIYMYQYKEFNAIKYARVETRFFFFFIGSLNEYIRDISRQTSEIHEVFARRVLFHSSPIETVTHSSSDYNTSCTSISW